MDKIFYIIDGNSLFYRAYYGIPPLSNTKGEPTNAVYGFTNILFKILKKPVDYVACAFDSPGPTFRHEKFAEYKSHRPGMPEELVRQLQPLKEVLQAMRIAVFEKEGYEADDLLATLAEKGKMEKCHLVIVTGDKDAMQLVGEGVSILQPGKEEKEITTAEVKEILGVRPSQVPDLIGLMGDSSDGLPGVPGIGLKTASKLIRDYEDLEGIFQHLDGLAKNSLAERLKKYQESCWQVRELATLKRDVPLGINWPECRYVGPDKARLIKIFRQLGFNRLIQRLLKEEDKKEADSSPEVLKGQRELNELITESQKRKELAVFFEKKNKALVLAADAASIFIFFSPFPAGLKELITDSRLRKIGHGFKEMVKFFWREGLDWEGLYFDLEIASYVLNPERPSHDLSGLALDYLEKMTGPGYSDIVRAVFSLYEKMARELKQAGQEELFYDMEMPLIKILAAMEREGFKVNRDKLARLSEKLAGEIAVKEERVFSLAGERFNLNSSQQLGRILFYKMELPPQKKTKTGLSTDSEVLETLAPLYPLAYEVLRWRELYKIKSTYVNGLAGLINPETGRLHTTFNQTITATGRLSSSNPNLQNIPSRGEMGQALRTIFEALPKKLLLSADYSQIELRILAHLSEDELMKEAFRDDGDIHAATARNIFKLKGEINKEMRQRAKMINFGLIYGMTGYGLAKELGLTAEEAQDYIDEYMARYSGVKRYLEFLVAEARKNGFSRTIFGRRRLLSGPNIERLAINTPIQGSAADIIKLAMVRIAEAFKKEKLETILVLQIHDELLFEVPESELKKVEVLVRGIMENVYLLSIPLKVNISWGKTWADLS